MKTKSDSNSSLSNTEKKLTFKTIILKISGEFLAGKHSFGFDDETIKQLTKDIIEVKKMDIAIGVVLGGGNIFRGAIGQNNGIDRVTGDNIGMLATLQNSLVLSNYIKEAGFLSETYSALQIDKVSSFYNVSDIKNSLHRGKICFLACGTGNPYFTTDTAAVLRALELNADLVLKGTKVDGVYCSDPKVNENAVFYDKLTYDEALNKRLQVMDLTAFSLARDNDLPIKVFNITKPGNFRNALTNTGEGTMIT